MSNDQLSNLIATIALVLSSAAIAISWYELRSNRAKLRITAGILAYRAAHGAMFDVYVEVINIGRQATTVTNVWVKIRNSNRSIFLELRNFGEEPPQIIDVGQIKKFIFPGDIVIAYGDRRESLFELFNSRLAGATLSHTWEEKPKTVFIRKGDSSNIKLTSQ